ncbi:MAG: bile acid:sodium symporter family protein [Candidatus Aminicenantes bacterium]|nr:bile acid:sodium symporter family protein [Candidatus Aminicenantes bacterium]
MTSDAPPRGRFRRLYKKYNFTLWVLVFVSASMLYPAAFRTWFGTDLKVLIVPLIQIITFGVGTTLSARDFKNVLAMPWPVLIGVGLQFTIMPFVGYGIAMTFGFPPEVAAGIILIGSVSSGVASNVMTYLAGGNVPLSVTITSATTLLSPFVTPFWMKTLAGRLVPVDFTAMMLSIFNMIIIPIFAGLIAHWLLYSPKSWGGRKAFWALTGVSFLAFAVGVFHIPARFWGALIVLKGGLALGFILLGLTILAKLVITVWLKRPERWMDKALPLISMAAICLIIAVITAQSRDQLLTVGPLLILAAILHNGAGYSLGYWGARLARLDEAACRAVAMEVGMQNGGMASGIAIDVLKSTSAALAPAIFGPWMNVSGSLLAGWWRRRPPAPAKSVPAEDKR